MRRRFVESMHRAHLDKHAPKCNHFILYTSVGLVVVIVMVVQGLVQGIARTCYSHEGPTNGHRLFTALSVCSHCPLGAILTNSSFRSEMLFRYSTKNWNLQASEKLVMSLCAD